MCCTPVVDPLSDAGVRVTFMPLIGLPVSASLTNPSTQWVSGSTGIPKGVVACHRSVLDYIEQLSDLLGFSEDTVFANQSPLYFDACLKELYPTIKFGATTYLTPKQLFMFPIKLVEYLNEHKVNTICWVVSALTMISAFQTFTKMNWCMSYVIPSR